MPQNSDQLNWYHGRITRDAATHILNEHGRQNGSFLVRDCSSAPRDYVLSMWVNNQVLHFQVHCQGDNKFSIDDGPIFHGLDSLVNHYQSAPDGLPCRLTIFCRGALPPSQTLKYGSEMNLHKYCTENNIAMVRKLLQESKSLSDINARNENGLTPLHIACKGGFDDIVALLLSFGASPKASDSNGQLPLQVACASGHSATASILIQNGGAAVQERSLTNGWVSMHEAAMRGHIDVVRVLLAFQASVNPRTIDGDTPRDLALRYGQYEIAEFLENLPLPPPKTKPSQWLHQNLDRQGAVVILVRHGMEDGMFLVRTSIKCHGYYVLSLALNGKAYHFQILSRADRYFYIDDGPLFETLPHVIDHYTMHMDGLPVLLQTPIAPEVDMSTRPAAPLPPRPSSIKPKAPRKPQMLPKRTPSRNDSGDATQGGSDDDDYNKMSDWQAAPSPPPRTPSTRQTAAPFSKPVNEDDKSQQTIISKDSLELGPELGVGEFGSVLKGNWTNTFGEKVPVAMKTLHQEKLQQGEQEFLREARVMSQLNHPCIVRLIGVCLGPPMILVQELVLKGALLDYLIDYQPEIAVRDLKLWAAQIAAGMMYLEQKRFVHRDLATRNILLLSKDQAKISDFGLSRAVGAGSDYYQASQGGRWPVKWYAPESITYGTFSHKSDVWSYGVTLWEMFTFGELPYGEQTGAQVLALLERGQRLEKPADCPNKTYQIMLRCWNIDPVQRPTFDQLNAIFSTDPEYEDSRTNFKQRPR